jgi:hypothetical protein
VPVGPVNGFKLTMRKAGNAEHGVVRISVGLSGENHSIIEDDGAQRQGSSYECAVYGVGGASSIVKDAFGAGALMLRSKDRDLEPGTRD